MDYERIQNTPPQGGSISPSKLRLMLLGVDRKRGGGGGGGGGEDGEKEELRFSLRSTDAGDANDVGGSSDVAARPDSCRDVDIVSSPAECSTSTGTGGDPRAKNQTTANTRGFRSQEEDCVDVESTMSSSAFEFHRADRASHRPSMLPPFAKAAPSKWDDAQKWIASPTFNRSGKGGGQVKRGGNLNHGSRMAAITKVIAEVAVEPDTKRIDHSQMKEVGGVKSVNCVYDSHPMAEAHTKTAVFEESSIDEDASAVNLSHHESSVSNQSATTFIQPPSTVRSVSMRDMGTEMTPIPSQDPSRSGTPVRASTPIRSPTSSRPSSPGRVAPNSTPAEYVGSCGDPNRRVLSDKELQMKTRREIMILGTKLGKPNIAAWASREEEEQDASRSLKTVPPEPPEKHAIEIRASAWEEAEKAKYLARFKREEIKIQAWENHQKAKAEADMRKVEVEVERIRVRAHEKLKDKLDAIRQKAEERRVAAEAKRNQQAAQTAEQVDYIRRTGKMPSSCWGCCS